jgi:hypothetical protein
MLRRGQDPKHTQSREFAVRMCRRGLLRPKILPQAFRGTLSVGLQLSNCNKNIEKYSPTTKRGWLRLGSGGRSSGASAKKATGQSSCLAGRVEFCGNE